MKKILASLVAAVLVSAVMVGGPVSPAFATGDTWTVTFDANSGSGSMADQTAAGSTALTSNSFTRQAYSFAGWNTAADGVGDAYADGSTFPFSSDDTLYAQWLKSSPSIEATHDIFIQGDGSNPDRGTSAHLVLKTGSVASGASGKRVALLRFDYDPSYVWTSAALDLVVSLNQEGNSDPQYGTSFTSFNVNVYGANDADWAESSLNFISARDTASDWKIVFTHPYSTPGATLLGNISVPANTIGSSAPTVGKTFSLSNPDLVTFLNNDSDGKVTFFITRTDESTQSNLWFASSENTIYDGPRLTVPTVSFRTVSFSSNGGSGSMADQTGAGSTALTSNSFTRQAYSFAGWNTAADGSGDPYADGASYAGASATFYAQWDPVVCVPETTTVGGETVLTFTSTTGCVWTAPAGVTEYDYVVVGGGGSGGKGRQGTTAGAGGSGGQVVQGRLTLVSGQSYEVIAGNRGVGFSQTRFGKPRTPTNTPGTASVFDAVTASGGNAGPSPRQRSGVVAGGSGAGGAQSGGVGGAALGVTIRGVTEWFAAGGGGHLSYNHSPARGGVGADGTRAGGDGQWSHGLMRVDGRWTDAAVEAVTYGSGGGGGNHGGNGGNTEYRSGNGYQGVVILREVRTDTVTFDANSGSGTMADQTAVGSTSLSANTFTTPSEGYGFAGWNTVSNGSGTAYADGATYDFSADLWLYAQWGLISTVIFDANSGSGSMADQTTAGSTALTPNSFTRQAYSFAGWNTAEDGSGTAYADGASYDFSANLTLYAQWSAIPPPPPAESESASAPLIDPDPAPVRAPGRAAPLPEADRPLKTAPVVIQRTQQSSGSSQPAAAVALVGGEEVAVKATTRGSQAASYGVGKVTVDVGVAAKDGVVDSVGGVPSLKIAKNSAASVKGAGFQPGSSMQVFLPVSNGSFIELPAVAVAADGSFDGSLTLRTSGRSMPMPIGKNSIQMVGVDDEGNETVLDIPVTIAQPLPAPEINRVSGERPALTPGQALAFNAGAPETVTLKRSGLATSVEGEDWAFTVAGSTTDESGQTLAFTRDAPVAYSGEGFMPGTRADVWLFSDPTLVGTVDIAADGTFSANFAVDSNFVPTGDHTLQIQGVGKDGFVRAANLGVVVEDPVSTPFAPIDSDPIGWVPLMIIGTSVGGLLVLVGVTLAIRRGQRANGRLVPIS